MSPDNDENAFKYDETDQQLITDILKTFWNQINSHFAKLYLNIITNCNNCNLQYKQMKIRKNNL